jgi:hypothetical protein
MNNDKRTIFIWDVHWCFDEFELLIEKLKIQDNDIIYLVWDMINKWPKSWKTMKFLYKNQDQYKCILWNNEVNFFRYLDKNSDIDYISDESQWIFKKLEKKIENKPKVLEYFKELPLYIDTEDYLLIHGWLDPEKNLEDHNQDELTRIREINDKPWFEQYKWNKKVIYWHWAQNWLNIYWNTIWLDWGCVYGRALHAYILESWDIVTQQALECYQDVFKKD